MNGYDRARWEVRIGAAEIAGNHEKAAELRRQMAREESMSKHTQNYEKAVAEMTDALVPALTELSVFEREAAEAAERGTPYAPSYIAASRKNIMQRVAVGDQSAANALNAFASTALADARAMRAAAEAERDPAARMADEMERARLVASATGAEAFAERAKSLLEAGQPQRAALMLAVAEDKGWRGGFETVYETDEITGAKFPRPVSTLQRLREGIEAALDEAVPQRASARAVEAEVATKVEEFRVERVKLLAKYGVGVADDGSLGAGRAAEVARASIGAKVAAMRAAQQSGAGYREPEGALSSRPTGGTVRARE